VIGRRLRVLALALAGLAAAASTQAQPSTAELRAEARAATERRDWPAALQHYEGLLQRHGDDVDLLIEAARVHGFADRNAQAAALYRRALALAPARRGDIVSSLAWQALWGGAPAEAAALFGELARAPGVAERADALDGLGQARQAQGDQAGALAAFREAHALAPGAARLHRRLAMSLLWNGQEAAAIRELQVLAAAAPADRDLGWALANARNFDGRHREALRDFARWTAPVHPGERADLARAWRWAGYPDRAAPLLADLADAESAWLRDWRVRRELAPYGYVTVERAEDRDALQTDAQVLGAGWHPGAGVTVDLQVRRLQLDDPAGRPRATQWQGSVGWRVGEPDSPWGTFWPTLALRVSDFAGWRPALPAARLRWLPADRWRVDAEAARELVEAPRAVANRVTVDVVSAGAEHRPDSAWLLAAAAAVLRFDDGSTRARAGGRIERRVLARPRVVVGAEGSAFERIDGGSAVDRGYWNPQRYGEARAYVALSHEWRPFDVQLRLGLGRSLEVDAAGNRGHGSPHLWELGLGWDLTPGLRLRLAAGGSGQGLGLNAGSGGGAGYWRRYLNLSADIWF
jgi:tetratricopeptide (TPR) repeat protein